MAQKSRRLLRFRNFFDEIDRVGPIQILKKKLRAVLIVVVVGVESERSISGALILKIWL